ncbi:MAG: hypothetical protein C4288_21350 [Leptolyngbya sp. ERB_1_1]
MQHFKRSWFFIACVIVIVGVLFFQPTNVENLYPVQYRDRFGYVNQSGIPVITPQFTQAKAFTEELAAIQFNDQKWGFINLNGEVAIAPQYDDALPFEGGVSSVKVGKAWGVINISGDWAIRPNNLYAAYPELPIQFYQGIATIPGKDVNTYSDKAGNLLSQSYLSEQPDTKIQQAKEFSEGFAIVRGAVGSPRVFVSASQSESEQNWGSLLCGFQNEQEQTIIPPQFHSRVSKLFRRASSRTNQQSMGLY